MESVWEKDLPRVRFDTLKANKGTDVLIIGGGIAGILCAYKLKNADVDCLLVEANEICGGITKNTTAKITLGHGLIYDKMIKRFGEHQARLYVDAQNKAIKEYARLYEDIDCDYEKRDNYVYSLSDCQKIEKEVVALNRLGVKAEFSNARELPFSVAGAVRVKAQVQFHPCDCKRSANLRAHQGRGADAAQGAYQSRRDHLQEADYHNAFPDAEQAWIVSFKALSAPFLCDCPQRCAESERNVCGRIGHRAILPKLR